MTHSWLQNCSPQRSTQDCGDRFLFVVEKTWRCFQKVGILLISVSWSDAPTSLWSWLRLHPTMWTPRAVPSYLKHSFYCSTVDWQCCIHFCWTAKWLSYRHIHSFLIFFLKNYLFLVVLGLHHCTWTFSRCGKQELLFIGALGLLIETASLVVHHRL